MDVLVVKSFKGSTKKVNKGQADIVTSVEAEDLWDNGEKSLRKK